MTTTEILVLVLVLLVVAAVVAAVMAQARKRKHLQSTFGAEYDRTVDSSGQRRAAERDLAEREQRRRSLDIRPLPEQDRLAYADRWRTAQADFVDHPEMAVRQADLLVSEVMGKRGYPVGDFEQMSRDVSVDHADTVHEYRAAHEISELNDRKQATTEQLRQAMVHYRSLFDDLLADRGPSADHGAATDRTTAADHGAAADRTTAGDHGAATDRTTAADHGAATERTTAADQGPVGDHDPADDDASARGRLRDDAVYPGADDRGAASDRGGLVRGDTGARDPQEDERPAPERPRT